MSHTLSQPEEIDRIMMEMAKYDVMGDSSLTDKKHAKEAVQESWSGSYVSPYRAVHMRLIDSVAGVSNA